MVQSHASNSDPVFLPRSGLKLIVLAASAVLLVLLAGFTRVGQSEFNGPFRLAVADEAGRHLGEIEVNPLDADGALRLGFARDPSLPETYKIQWWQLAEREDRSGYPRIDPQSGGSGLPGAKGEDEDPAYYSESDFADPNLAPLIFKEGKFWLLDRPTHDSGFRFESWLVMRTGPKSITLLQGVRWGITVKGGTLIDRHDPLPVRHLSHFDWHESLRISGFGSGWEIKSAYHSTLP